MSRLIVCVALLLSLSSWAPVAHAQSAVELKPEQRSELEHDAKELQKRLDTHSSKGGSAWADAAVFAKGLTWALRYDHEFSPADLRLLQSAGTRCRDRLRALSENKSPWRDRRGKLAVGYQSAVDGSIQPYGLIVPSTYDGQTPIRLDVVLHGSTRPVGISELRFIGRFDEGDAAATSVPDHPYIELHPLGRVENCYRWSGETDVFEAIEDVCRRYNIDRTRIVLRGMSMGASGTWHLGLKHPDRFAALGPYCGYVDTHRFSETPVPGFVKVGPLPEHQELGLHMLDSVDYAANARVVPAIACMGEKDVFFQAHVLMGEAMAREGLTMVNLISPGTGHVIDPVTHAEQLRRIAEICDEGQRSPKQLRFVTWTLKYNRCHWLQILGLDQHYSRAEFAAELRDGVIDIKPPRNISRFAIEVEKLPSVPKLLRVETAELSLPDRLPGRLIVSRQQDTWAIDNKTDSQALSGKRPGLQGPIDDAFTTPFLCVRGTGPAWNTQVNAYAQASLRRFAEEWHHYFRGELPVKNDVDVTDDDVRTRNLILFGDPGSNAVLAKVLPHLPVRWTRDSVSIKGQQHPAIDHLPALIAPNPLPGGGSHYVVINSGHTFRAAELSKLNYLLFPRWGDWAVLKLDSSLATDPLPDDNVIRAGYFDESWK